jgi:hypothetical protein
LKPNEEDQPSEVDKLVLKEENQEEMDVDEKDKNLDAVKDSDPIKSMLQTANFTKSSLTTKIRRKRKKRRLKWK